MKLIQIPLGAFASLRGYLPEPGGPAVPAILIAPGGGFRVCARREGEPVALAFLAEGYAAFVLDYTTLDKKPDAVMADPMADCAEALRTLRERGEALGLQKGRLALLGFSAGGHLAAAAATHGPERPDLLLLGYPGILHSERRALECPDIPERTDGRTPPTFLFSTRDDPVVPPAHPLAFVRALEAAGVEYELHIFRHGGHALSLGTALTAGGDPALVNASFAQWFPLAVRWLREHWGEVR
ncbi:MAG: alpha/beta hydrolase [Oscillospiraceae bacterium]|nr:alpha/beta hydrolase [Oscillospiraceae bacterium]